MADPNSNKRARQRLSEYLQTYQKPQRKLAAELDMDPAILSKILRGVRVPTVHQSVDIARVVGIAGTNWGHSLAVLKRFNQRKSREFQDAEKERAAQ